MAIFNHKGGHHFSTDGADIYFETLGNPHGKPLVLIHGGLGYITDLNCLLEAIPNGYRIIGIDLRGHGKSTLGTAPLSYEQYQKDIEAILKHLAIDTFSLLGFSDGGIVSYRLAARFNTKVEKLITIGSQWRLEENDPSIEFLAHVTPDDWLDMFPDSVSYYNKINPQPDFERLVNEVKTVWMDTARSGYPSSDIRTIKCPTLIIRGDSDFLLSLQEAVEIVDQIDNAAFMNIAFAEHEAHKECPQICCSVIQRFLTEE
ncbi:alpha/beta fold hydrolase [Photobacterium sp. OFAV2-7]|uniref:alpha/beta fold hydrolase n=1 Tax=Photobacterium sp. OFAV2-7 TaxID=2917748 RepID=UPI001EF4BABE|nr:alpha/beta hydrolase [Photobacterium sp. OFAV2-7]MCG7585889.1 alpha/beta hydrolase [Photobacterium sp. OFAV2-7]